MRKFNFFYYGKAIQMSYFLQNVPEDWEIEVIDGHYSCGGFDANEIGSI